jgi:hypothetical protein
MTVTAVHIPPVGEIMHERGLRIATNTLEGSDADTAGTFTLFEIGPNVFIHEVKTQVATALPSGITTTIGNSTDVDTWLLAATIADTVAVTTGLWKSSYTDCSSNEFGIARGWYSGTVSTDVIAATITGALAATGKINVAVVFSEF